MHDAENHLCGDAERAFGADEDAEEIVAGSVESLAAEVDELAVGEDDFEAEDVRGGEAVLEAVGAAGVFGDIAADGADGLRRGIGRVEDSRAGGRAAVTSRLMTPGSTMTRALGRSTSRMRFMRARLMTMPSSAGSAPPLRPVPAPRATKGMLCVRRRGRWPGLARCGGEDDGAGHGAEVGEAVALVGLELFGRGDEAAGAGDGAEFGEEGGVHGRLGKGYYGEGRMGSWEQMGQRSY